MGMLPDDFDKAMFEIFNIITRGIKDLTGLDLMCLEITKDIQEYNQFIAKHNNYINEYIKFIVDSEENPKMIVVFKEGNAIVCDNITRKFVKERKNKEDLNDIEKLYSLYIQLANINDVNELLDENKYPADTWIYTLPIITSSIIAKFVEYEGLYILVPLTIEKVIKFDISEARKVANEYLENIYNLIYDEISRKRKGKRTRQITISEKTKDKMNELTIECMNNILQILGKMVDGRLNGWVFSYGKREDNEDRSEEHTD